MMLPCTQGWGWMVVPILHQSHRPSPQASQHQGRQCILACPSPINTHHNKL